MKLIELHILQSFPVTCLNRDDVGAPKSAVFGGEPRARVSSQCWKRAIRLLARDTQPELFAGRRGHFMAERLQGEIEQRGVEPAKAKEAAETIATALGSHDKKHKEAHKTSVALYLSPQELAAVADTVANTLNDGKKVDVKRGEVKKALQNLQPRDIADIAIFGRMVADDHSLTVEGAGMFSHALSTHRVSNEIDFFSAVDDLKPEETAGAGHIGTLEFNAACYYRYVGVNCDRLADDDHLGHLQDQERQQVLSSFLRTAIEAIPNARHNSMLGHNPPACVLGRVRRGQPLSLANAFEKPINPRGGRGYVEPSKEAMRDHHDRLKRVYGLNDDQEAWLDPDDDNSPDLDTFIKGLLNHD